MYFELDYTIIRVHLIGSVGYTDLKQDGTNKPFGSASTTMVKTNYMAFLDFNCVIS